MPEPNEKQDEPLPRYAIHAMSEEASSKAPMRDDFNVYGAAQFAYTAPMLLRIDVETASAGRD